MVDGEEGEEEEEDEEEEEEEGKKEGAVRDEAGDIGDLCNE